MPVRKQLAQEAVTCVDYNVMLPLLDQIVVDVQLTSEFFDPNQYMDDEGLPLQVNYEQSSLNRLFAQTKEFAVALDDIDFRPSLFNNRLPSYRDTIETFFV